jgi:uncharacterized protein with FMN-binding domain
MQRAVKALSTIAVVALPFVNVASRAAAAATAVKRKTVWKRVAGPQAQADRWGYVQVVLIVRKTTTTSSAGSKVTRRITGVTVPVYPDHTGRSQFISENSLPILISEALRAQTHANVDLVSGATYTSEAFTQSLQSAILKAKKV